MQLVPVFIATLVVCVGYGISFALFAKIVSATGVSGFWIGLNATLPALGWIFGSLLVPILQLSFRIEIKKIAIFFLILSLFGLGIPIISNNYFGISATRFVFGGAMGVFLRCVEYTIAAQSTQQNRGTHLAIYGAAFLIGLIAGSALQPQFGEANTLALAVIAGFLVVGTIILCQAQIALGSFEQIGITREALALFPVVPVAIAAVAAYALYESVPAYLLQVYSLRSGLDESVAAYTLSAAALGNLVALLPLLMLSDRIGRLKVLAACAFIASFTPLVISAVHNESAAFLASIAILGAVAGVTYGLALAMLGDRFSGAAFVLANALFGVIYASGSVAGPMLHGIAMEVWGNAGLLYSTSAVFMILSLTIGMDAARKRKPG